MQKVISVSHAKSMDEEFAKNAPLKVLIDRAGFGVAQASIKILGSCYGKKVIIVAGPGNNGEDGKVAAYHLKKRGCKVTVLSLDQVSGFGEFDCDLVVDAAFGTGLKREYVSPSVQSKVPILAVDIPSGLDGETGNAYSHAVRADETLTFQAMKVGQLIGDGPSYAGKIRTYDIGLEIGESEYLLAEDRDTLRLFKPLDRDHHKWKSACLIIAGSRGMDGSAKLSCSAALRSGAGMVRHISPNGSPVDMGEVVSLPGEGNWSELAISESERCCVVGIGPGIGLDQETLRKVLEVIDEVEVPVIVDADALAVVEKFPNALAILERRRELNRETVLTPHLGEFKKFIEENNALDIFNSLLHESERLSSTILLKGATTTVVDSKHYLDNPERFKRAVFVQSGTSRLATAGSGDVLFGLICGFLAHQFASPNPLTVIETVALSAQFHGYLSRLFDSEGLIASDLVTLIPGAFVSLMREFAGGYEDKREL